MDKAGAYDIFDGEKKVGQLDLSLLERFSSEHPGCPAGWVGKPVLEIDGLGIFDNTDNGGHGRGCGRFVLQECYKLAQKVSEGRIVVHATWGAGPFYEHCGFKGQNPGQEGIKYFEPTPEAMQTLFPKGKTAGTTLSLRERPQEDFQLDLRDVFFEASAKKTESSAEALEKNKRLKELKELRR